jgi:hypothetical protein
METITNLFANLGAEGDKGRSAGETLRAVLMIIILLSFFTASAYIMYDSLTDN